MKTQSNEYPSMIQKLDSKTYVFNYNIVEIENEDSSIYEYDQTVINSDTIDQDDIIRNTLIENWDINQQLKLVNDYFAFTLGLETDKKYKTRYEDFLQFRSKMKAYIAKGIL